MWLMRLSIYIGRVRYRQATKNQKIEKSQGGIGGWRGRAKGQNFSPSKNTVTQNTERSVTAVDTG